MKISQLAAYQSDWLTGGDLLELGPVTVTIERVTLEELYRSEEKMVVLSFAGKRKRLVLNKTRAQQMVQIGGDDTDGWVGLVVRLVPAKQNSKNTIHIMAAQ